MLRDRTKSFAVDLGTKNIVIIHNGQTLIDDEAVIAVMYESGEPKMLCGIGKRVYQRLWKGGLDIRLIRPFERGKVENEYLFRMMLEAYIKRALFLSRPKWQRRLIEAYREFVDAPSIWMVLIAILIGIVWLICR